MHCPESPLNYDRAPCCWAIGYVLNGVIFSTSVTWHAVRKKNNLDAFSVWIVRKRQVESEERKAS